jgi:hypothetical protein
MKSQDKLDLITNVKTHQIAKNWLEIMRKIFLVVKNQETKRTQAQKQKNQREAQLINER